MRTFFKFIFVWLLPPAALLALGVLFFAMSLYPKPGPLNAGKIVYIESGSSTRGIADKLVTEGVMEPIGQYVFLSAARLRHANLKAGEYAFAPEISVKDALALVESGKTYQRQITIAEGLMSFEIVEAVNGAQAMEGTVADIPPDGALLPETYSYSRGDDKTKLIERMKAAMAQALAQAWEKRDPGVPLKTPEEALTLASVVEKETGVAAERPRVAGVFINRLKLGMPLQTDPTVIYALTEGKKRLERPLLRKDLAFPSSYNTYLNPGLPPGPIANPGRLSIEAVLHPETHDFIYFVADGSGGHAFAKTLPEHQRNVEQWRRIQK